MIAAQTPPAPAAADSPYKLLDYFGDSPEDRARFGGREREVRELVASITNDSTLVVYGPSGIGKTSLLLAGVFPVLRERGYRTVYARTLVQPLDDLRKAIVAGCNLGELGEPRQDEDLRSLVARATEDKPLVVVLDQFEEFFNRFREQPEDRAAFIAGLAGALRDPSLVLTVVFSLREDYLASLDEFNPQLPEPLADRRYRLQPMTAFGARQAISKPLVRAGIGYEQAAVSELVAQLEQVGFEPLLLQILCSELYREAVQRTGGGVPHITVQDLEQLGGTDGIFRRYLNSSVEALPPESHLLARMVLDALITSESTSTRRAANLEDLLHARFYAEKKEVQEILKLLAGRLLRHQVRDNEEWCELIHERLIPYLKMWLNDREFIEFRQARDYVLYNCEGHLWRRSPEALLSEWALATLLGPHQERFRFDERELEFVLRSALYRRTASAAFWAGRFGTERTIHLIERLATSGAEEERLGAIASASALQDSEGRLARLCVHLALEDGSEAVRRAAGLSLARLAQDEDLDTLALALVNRATKKRAKAAFASMQAGGHPLARFGRIFRFFARLRGQQQILSEHRQALGARRLTGLASGALAGLAWTIILPLLAVLFVVTAAHFEIRTIIQDLRGIRSSLSHYSRYTAPALGLLPVVGALLGALAANAVAKRAALYGEGRWLSALSRSAGLFCGAILPGFALAYAPLTELLKDGSGMAEVLPPWLLWTLATLWIAAFLHIVLALVVHVGRPCVWPEVSSASTWVWSFLVGLGLPLLPIAIALSFLRNPAEPGRLLIEVCLITGFASSAALVAITRSATKNPLHEPPEVAPAARRRCRAAIVALVFVNLGLCGLSWLLK